MSWNQQEQIANQRMSMNDIIQSIINSKKITNLGRIAEVYNDNFIKVKLYNGDYIDTVRLVHTGTAKCRVSIQPMIGDNVICFTTQIYVEDTNVDINEEASNVIAPPYSNSSMNAILISPEHDIDVLTYLHIDEDGNTKIETQGKVDVAVTEPPQNKKDNEDAEAKVLEQILIDQESIIINDEKNKTKIILDKDGIKGLNEQNLMLEFGNSVSTLGKLVSDLIDKLIQLKTIGSPYQHTLDPGTITNLQAVKQQWEKVFK